MIHGLNPIFNVFGEALGFRLHSSLISMLYVHVHEFQDSGSNYLYILRICNPSYFIWRAIGKKYWLETKFFNCSLFFSFSFSFLSEVVTGEISKILYYHIQIS